MRSSNFRWLRRPWASFRKRLTCWNSCTKLSKRHIVRNRRSLKRSASTSSTFVIYWLWTFWKWKSLKKQRLCFRNQWRCLQTMRRAWQWRITTWLFTIGRRVTWEMRWSRLNRPSISNRSMKILKPRPKRIWTPVPSFRNSNITIWPSNMLTKPWWSYKLAC